MTSLEAARRMLSRYGLDDNAVLLSNILEMGKQLNLQEGARFCMEGGNPDTAWFLISGRVQVLKRDMMGVERHLSDVAPPSLLGHMALINRHRRSASCVTLGPTVLREVDVRTFKKLLNGRGPEHDLFRGLLVRVLAKQLEAGNAELLDILEAPAEVEIWDDETTSESMWSAEGAFSGWSDHGESDD
ncbi:MAG: cyclic nucleotide-binding domain-containing protein [Proteobacteria bacterium]|nr:cyclic nucleotide-binding domain-containing protein [Pseudomonadota bacterium]MCP4921965.1 cyclic nucleotide-binding domain-containing protein [Pseudomonadota bacterium]